jgi:hypothetical protein
MDQTARISLHHQIFKKHPETTNPAARHNISATANRISSRSASEPSRTISAPVSRYLGESFFTRKRENDRTTNFLPNRSIFRATH